MLASSASGDNYIPGSYPMIQDPRVHLNQSIGFTSTSTSISPPLLPVAFGSAGYRGSVSAWDSANWTASDWTSVFLPDTWYAVLGSGQVIWAVVPHSGQLRSVSDASISRVASGTYNSCPLWSCAYSRAASCSPSCSTGGICITKDSGAPTCECRTGWTGAACESCATGYFGPTCARESQSRPMSRHCRCSHNV